MTPSSLAAPAERLARFNDLLDPLVAELEPLHLALNHANWQASITGKDEFVQESARLDATIRKLLSRSEPFEVLVGLKRSGGLSEPLAQRQLDVLINACRQHQLPADLIDRMVTLEKQLDSRFNNFRAQLGGEPVSDNRLRELLRTSDDPAVRRHAWEASKQIGAEVEPDLLELVRLRNQAARSLGFDNYYSMMLELDELDETELFGILDELERGTSPLFEAYKREVDAAIATRFGTTPAALRPWHYGDPFFQEAPAAAGVNLDPHFEGKSLEDLTRRFFAAVGFDIEPMLAHSDLHEKPGKGQHAFCMSLDRGADVRVLCNIRSNEYWMGTMLHEFGHAVYDQHVDRNLPWLLRQHAHILTTEASAMLFGRLSKNATWLRVYAGVDPDAARRAADATARAVRNQLLVLTRWCLVMCHMERALYRVPGQDLNALWWDLVERLQLIRRPEGRDAPDWASKIHFSVAPVYYHNYMLGEMMASQLQHRLLEHVGGDGEKSWERYVSSEEVGRFLIERLYSSGRSVDWRGAIREATGAALQTSAFVAELGRA